jgi:hypothetical protein
MVSVCQMLTTEVEREYGALGLAVLVHDPERSLLPGRRLFPPSRLGHESLLRKSIRSLVGSLLGGERPIVSMGLDVLEGDECREQALDDRTLASPIMAVLVREYEHHGHRWP